MGAHVKDGAIRFPHRDEDDTHRTLHYNRNPPTTIDTTMQRRRLTMHIHTGRIIGLLQRVWELKYMAFQRV
jgi:hypothetical protein